MIENKGTWICKRKLLRGLIFSCALSGMMTGIAPAWTQQIGTQPYSFKGAPPGMSNSGREALLRQKLYGETPRNLLRAPNDTLLSVEPGPGNTAIVSTIGGNVIPGYRGSSVMDPARGQDLGIFNAFFRVYPVYRTSALSFSIGGMGTETSIAGWTSMVSDSGGMLPFSTYANPVESWTSQVYLYFAN